MERAFEPKFRAGAEDWDLACDGQALLVRGKAIAGPTRPYHHVNSIVPLLAISDLEILSTESGHAVSIAITIWDGSEFKLHYTKTDVQAIETSLLRLARHVRARNLAWPLGSARAVAARRQIQPGYLRDRQLLGAMGLREFWSPLAEIPWNLTQLVASHTPFTTWPKAVLQGINRESEAIMVLYEDGLVVLAEDGPRFISNFGQLQPPSLESGATDNTGTPSDLGPFGVMLKTEPHPASGTSQSPQSMDHFDRAFFVADPTSLQNAYRYILYRWAGAQAKAVDDASLLLHEAAERLESGSLAPEAFSILVEAAIARSHNASLSESFPPEERPYFTNPTNESKNKPAVKRSDPRPQKPSTTSSSTQNMRRAAAGAAGAAAIFGFFSD